VKIIKGIYLMNKIVIIIIKCGIQLLQNNKRREKTREVSLKKIMGNIRKFIVIYIV